MDNGWILCGEMLVISSYIRIIKLTENEQLSSVFLLAVGTIRCPGDK